VPLIDKRFAVLESRRCPATPRESKAAATTFDIVASPAHSIDIMQSIKLFHLLNGTVDFKKNTGEPHG
jgi:hypothetical protein